MTHKDESDRQTEGGKWECKREYSSLKHLQNFAHLDKARILNEDNVAKGPSLFFVPLFLLLLGRRGRFLPLCSNTAGDDYTIFIQTTEISSLVYSEHHLCSNIAGDDYTVFIRTSEISSLVYCEQHLCSNTAGG